MQPGSRRRLAATLAVALLAYAVILMGAYVRLSDAGLGCPDWPGCYGSIDVASSAPEVERANAAFPDRPLEPDKAWLEMVHRYLAGGLGLAILLLALLHRRLGGGPRGSGVLAAALVGLVIFQAALGMWTVTLLVKPLVVTAHLLGGFAVLALLWLLALGAGLWPRSASGERRLLAPLGLGLAILLVQIALGGWTSSNYAAVACVEFPACQGGDWWPEADFREGFVPWRGLGVDYQYGVLEPSARTAIHLAHRFGALATLVYLGSLFAFIALRARSRPLRRAALAAGALLLVQVALGIANVLGGLPLPVAVAHNGVAALLLLALVTLLWGAGREAAGRGERHG